MKTAKNIFNKGHGAKLDYEMLINNISDNKYKNNDTQQIFRQLATLNLIHRIQFIYFLSSTNEMQSLEDRKYLLMKKNCYSFKKKNPKFFDLTTESVHPLNSSFAAFQTFCAFRQYKKTICNSKFWETMFNRTCTTFDSYHVEQMRVGREYNWRKLWFQTRIMFFYAYVFVDQYCSCFCVQCNLVQKKKAKKSKCIERRFWFTWSTS